MLPCQGRCREFESLCPLQTYMIILDDFAPLSYQQELKKMIKDTGFQWGYYQTTSGNVGIKDDVKVIDNPQLVHTFYNDVDNYQSNLYSLAIPMVILLEKHFNKPFLNRLHRIKCNLVWQQPNHPLGFYNQPHVDVYKSDSETLLYYVEDSDGDTVLFNQGKYDPGSLTEAHRVSPKQGRAVLFDSSKYHASSPPIFNKTRIVINYVFYK
jgi:hypothetical protein